MSAPTMEIYSTHSRSGTVELSVSRRTAEKMEIVHSAGWDRAAFVPAGWAENIRRMDRSEARAARKRRQEIRSAGPGGDQPRDPDDPSQGRAGSKEMTFSDAHVLQGDIEKGLETGRERVKAMADDDSYAIRRFWLDRSKRAGRGPAGAGKPRRREQPGGEVMIFVISRKSSGASKTPKARQGRLRGGGGGIIDRIHTSRNTLRN